MERCALFFDIDGTLIDYQGTFAESAATALRKAQKAGHVIVLATGRNYIQVYPVLKAFGFDAMVCASGADVICDGKTIFHRSIPEEQLRVVFDYFEGNGFQIGLQGRTGTFVTQHGYEVMRARFQGMGVAQSQIDIIMDTVTIISDVREAVEIEKMFYNKIAVPVEEVQKAVGPYFYVAPSSFGNQPDPYSGEITVRGLEKTIGIAKVLEYYGIPKERAYAFGDAANDIGMMQAVGCGVAMGNAWPEVKAAADYVTAAIDEDGIAKAIDALGLLQ